MKKMAAVILSPLLILAALGLAACSQQNTGAQSGAPPNEVDMGAYSFVQTGATISAGQNIHFVDQQSGTMHILCIGRDGHCDASARGPQALMGQGFTIQPGQSHDVVFDTPGTYTVTCTIHPGMNVKITVH
jgi:plastocyanin